MTRLPLALYAAGALAAACAILTAEVALWIPTTVCAFVATFLYSVADTMRDEAYAREEAARPRGPNSPEPRPCCPFWAASGEVHAPLCRNALTEAEHTDRSSAT